MQAVNRLAVAVGTSVLVSIMITAPTHACSPSDPRCEPSGGTTTGDSEGDTITAGARTPGSVRIRGGNEGGGDRPIRVAGNYKPPTCILTRKYSAEEMETSVHQALDPPSVGHDYKTRVFEEYGDFHKGDDGAWWGWTPTETATPDEAIACINRTPLYQWFDTATPPTPAQIGITAEDLAMMALEWVRVPSVRFTSSPAVTQTVNLPTWLWTESTAFDEVEVTASLEGIGLSSTVTAKPEKLVINPGTESAEVHDSRCLPAGASGRIGVPYAKGARGAPPCGVTYRRASTAGDYQLSATLTWSVTWTSSTGEGGTLTDATSAGDPQPVAVQEIQTVVGDSR